MSDCRKDILAILSSQIFQDLCSCGKIELSQLYAAINFLVKANISFNLTFNEGTHATASSATLIVNITPSTAITRLFQFEPGESQLF